jgi:hypothetical protein
MVQKQRFVQCFYSIRITEIDGFYLCSFTATKFFLIQVIFIIAQNHIQIYQDFGVNCLFGNRFAFIFFISMQI